MVSLKKSVKKKATKNVTKKAAKKFVKKKSPAVAEVDPDKGQPKTVKDTKSFSAELVQIEYHPAPNGRVDVHVYLDQGRSKILLTGIRQLCLDGVWVVTHR